jgi:hypothetical protein
MAASSKRLARVVVAAKTSQRSLTIGNSPQRPRPARAGCGSSGRQTVSGEGADGAGSEYPPSGAVIPFEAEAEIAARRDALTEKVNRQTSGRYARFILAALSGIPWVGALLGAGAALHGEFQQDQLNELHRLWLEEHQAKMARLGQTLSTITTRFDGLGEDIQERIQSEEYLGLIRKGFRSWDQADTEEKREFIRKVLTNAGATKLCADDLVRLFLAWIDAYHESHFAVIREIYQRPGSTRAQIWQNIHGEVVRENSAEADLFKLLIRDLSTGSVIRQERTTDGAGNFLRAQRPKTRSPASPYVETAFEDTKRYELTELGEQFVHYTMDDLVPRVGDASSV